jgi:hypothetical protein
MALSRWYHRYAPIIRSLGRSVEMHLYIDSFRYYLSGKGPVNVYRANSLGAILQEGYEQHTIVAWSNASL